MSTAGIMRTSSEFDSDLDVHVAIYLENSSSVAFSSFDVAKGCRCKLFFFYIYNILNIVDILDLDYIFLHSHSFYFSFLLSVILVEHL